MIKVIYFDINNPISLKEDLSLCLGYFDGIHLGHMKLIEEAKKSPFKKAMVTFSLSPYDFLHNQNNKVIMKLRNRVKKKFKKKVKFLNK